MFSFMTDFMPSFSFMSGAAAEMFLGSLEGKIFHGFQTERVILVVEGLDGFQSETLAMVIKLVMC